MIRFSMALFLVIAACNTNNVYHKEINIQDREWSRFDTLSYTFNIDDINNEYNFYYAIRNGIDYPNYNLYIRYTLKDSTGEVYQTELQNMDLFHPKTGRPFGKGSIGDIYEHEILALEKFKFPYQGMYHMDLQHYMRIDSLADVLSVGLIIEPSQQD